MAEKKTLKTQGVYVLSMMSEQKNCSEMKNYSNRNEWLQIPAYV